ncbi:MAG: CDP-diacylglycerol--serine O-phosphatidyltransferase [Ignavibacteriaceae bacterium]|jgi:CDP-diacylglycerol--serine O-phosphatidyltransferase|nr:CDP-diacylglycerol--serine O-phosphatidyltransferase [Ignavibacteriaceae bacterium]HPO56980.1 CDP-diacylglycerol--serine O-phosphatidyltransferase [Ignavibacteriaceae bacterium]
MKNNFSFKPAFPNLVTTANIFFGFWSVIKVAQGDFLYGAYFILIAAVADALDGIVARMINTSSKFGVELDSLADAVSFGLAPAFLIYSAFLTVFEGWGIAVSSLLLIFGAYRLARFNSTLLGFDKKHFVGLPIPASAIMIASYVIMFANEDYMQKNYAGYAVFLTLFLSFLMVSKIRYDTLPKFSRLSLKENKYIVSVILVSIPLLLIFGLKVLFYIFIFVILFGIFRHIVRYFLKKK